jgi:lysophospholipase L1-like esterase
LFLAGLFGAMLSLSLVFTSQRVQESLRWRSDQWFDRVPASQLIRERDALAIAQRGAAAWPKSSVVLLGDSHLQAIPSNVLGPQVINLAVGGLTAARLLTYLKSAELVLPEDARRIVILIGHNDLNEDAAGKALERNFAELLAITARTAPVLVLRLLPIKVTSGTGPQVLLRRHQIDRSLERSCAAIARCKVESVFPEEVMQPHDIERLLGPDGIHLSAQGYTVFVSLLRRFVGIL